MGRQCENPAPECGEEELAVMAQDKHFGIAEYTQDVSHFHFCDTYPDTL